MTKKERISRLVTSSAAAAYLVGWYMLKLTTFAVGAVPPATFLAATVFGVSLGVFLSYLITKVSSLGGLADELSTERVNLFLIYTFILYFVFTNLSK